MNEINTQSAVLHRKTNSFLRRSWPCRSAKVLTRLICIKYVWQPALEPLHRSRLPFPYNSLRNLIHCFRYWKTLRFYFTFNFVVLEFRSWNLKNARSHNRYAITSRHLVGIFFSLFLVAVQREGNKHLISADVCNRSHGSSKPHSAQQWRSFGSPWTTHNLVCVTLSEILLSRRSEWNNKSSSAFTFQNIKKYYYIFPLW